MATSRIIRTFGVVKCTRNIVILLLGILTGMPSVLSAKHKVDSLPLLKRIFTFNNDSTQNIEGIERNVYMKFRYDIKRRNPTMWIIPTMYPLARGKRTMLMESYNRLHYNSSTSYDNQQQVVWGTVPHNRKAMTPILEFLTPNIYSPTIYRKHTLSPFHKSNRHFYQYTIKDQGNGYSLVTFRPRIRHNTQLVSGTAYVENKHGRVTMTILKGEFDGIKFNTEVVMGTEGALALLPDLCFTHARFDFMGNKVYAEFEASYNCPVTLPDSLRNVKDRALLDSLRPSPLIGIEQTIYNQYDSAHSASQKTAIDTVKHPTKNNSIANFFEIIGENLVGNIRAGNEKASLRIYPLLSPQYLSYSSHHGLSYKIRMKSRYITGDNSNWQFNPRLGYNFKYKKFYFTLPLRYDYDKKRGSYVEMVYGNGNRTGHATLIDQIREKYGDDIDLSNKMIDTFDDDYIRLSNYLQAFRWLGFETGLSFHQRNAYNPKELRKLQMPTEYRSFAPFVSLKLSPWKEGPVFTTDYERGIKGVHGSNTDYERWEFDASMKHKFAPIRKINMRIGYGFYSRKQGSDFVDYANFRDNNLPEGWDDDYTGNFQLLNSRWYNDSKYYARANISYESPLILLSWLPVGGHFLESERFYLSALRTEHIKPYYEVGYGFSTRFFNMGLFTSILDSKFRNIECKFTFELFRRW